MSDCYAMLLQAASNGGKPVASIPGYLKSQHFTRATGSHGNLAGSLWSGGVAEADAGAAAGPAQQPQPVWSASSQPTPVAGASSAWQHIHISADGISLDPADPACQGAGHPPYQAELEQQQQAGQQVFGMRRTSSASLESQRGWVDSAGNRGAWQESAEAGACEGLQPGSLPSMRSRASSASSAASLLGATAAAAGAEEGLDLRRRTSSGSLHSIGGGGSGPQPQSSPGSMLNAAGAPQLHRREKIRVRLKLRADGPKALQ